MTAVAKWAQQQLQAAGTDVASFVLLPPKVQLPAAGLAADGAVQWLKVALAHGRLRLHASRSHEV